MESERRVYEIGPIVVNEIKVSRVIIDSHYQVNHSESINDSLIIELVKKLNGRNVLPDSKKGIFTYFVTIITHNDRRYKLIWLLEENAIYVGVINAYRKRK